MAVLHAAHVHFTGKRNVNWSVAFLPEAVTHFESSRIEIRGSVFRVIDGYPAIDHQLVRETVLDREIMPLKISVVFFSMTVVKPVFRLDRPFLDSLKNEGFVDVILAMSIGTPRA